MTSVNNTVYRTYSLIIAAAFLDIILHTIILPRDETLDTPSHRGENALEHLVSVSVSQKKGILEYSFNIHGNTLWYVSCVDNGQITTLSSVILKLRTAALVSCA